MERAKGYGKRAEELRTLADNCVDDRASKALGRLARQYERWAEEAVTRPRTEAERVLRAAQTR